MRRTLYFPLLVLLLLGSVVVFRTGLLDDEPAPLPEPRGPAVAAGGTLDAMRLPRLPDSVRFAVIGDGGTGGRAQYEVAAMMAKAQEQFRFEIVLMCGDNIYGGQTSRDFARKFELPYKVLLDRGVKFHAALGNHDNPNQRSYRGFNMGGERYYSFEKGNVRFFALDSNYMNDTQIEWLERELREADEDWKICFLHHPLYSSGGRHGSDMALREVLEPIFARTGVRVVFAGHDHIYERLHPQKGIHHFVSGAAGQLRFQGVHTSPFTAASFARDRHFVMVEVARDALYFQVVSREGKTVDSGTIPRAPSTSTQ